MLGGRGEKGTLLLCLWECKQVQKALWNVEKDTNALTYKTEVESEMQKTNLRLLGDKAGRDKLGDWD